MSSAPRCNAPIAGATRAHPLDRALDVALACGAELLARRAREQLQALGARPRSVMLTGAESLTPSERRVCRLAAEGLSNPEIAQALCVSIKTVESRLRSSFRKLDIASRERLRAVIGASRPRAARDRVDVSTPGSRGAGSRGSAVG